MELKELTEQLNAASTEIKSAQIKMQEEIKANGEVSAETKSALVKHESSMTELKDLFSKVDDKLKTGRKITYASVRTASYCQVFGHGFC